MSDNSKIELARRMIEAMDMGDLRAVDELVHPDHRDHAAEDEMAGRDGVRRTMEWIHETFREPQTEIQDLIAAGDRVVARARFSARQIGELEGMPPAGREFAAEQIHIWRVADGMLAEHWMVRGGLS